jgi:alpha-D-xyloside xylohydrolase
LRTNLFNRSCRKSASAKRIVLLPTALFIVGMGPSTFGQMPGQSIPDLPRVIAQQSEHGIHAAMGSEAIDVTICSQSIIHVVAHPDAPPARPKPKPWLLEGDAACPGVAFQFVQDAHSATVKTSVLQVELNLERGNLSFRDASGAQLLQEGNSLPRAYEPVQWNGENTYRVTDRFSPTSTEAFYGLGQHQSGMFNYRGATIELAQDNTDVAIPVLMSSKGYALLWNTAALTYVDNRFPLELTLSSIAGTAVDYYFLYGPEMDTVIHEYRVLTGHAPLLPKWAYGLFQSKDRYLSLDEISAIAQRYRQEHIPLDAMVQDWFWWKTEGDPEFNTNYHDVAADLENLHRNHIHTMISVWGLLDPNSETYKILDSKNLLIPGAHVYDPSSAEARDIYWNRLPGKLLSQGWDAFWLDSAEPEEYWPHMGDGILRNKRMAIGNGAEYTNVFPLLHTLGAQDHWRSTTEQKRVFLLTRSAFLGEQRVGATVWSGDVYSTYWGLSHQVAAGLNFALSGHPYWTTDIGGYWPPDSGSLDTPEFQELYARWFEFGAFCPVFRTHGHRPHNEMWTYDKVEPTLIEYDRLRYRMMPYIYSLAWKVTSEDYTIQRPLVMDWRTDERTWNVGDQFMFGPAILVSPVLKGGATHRAIYLPASRAWYNFWTGETLKGSQEIEADAPLERMPLFVRAGSILPLGPEIEYADQKPDGPIEIRVYRGADGVFNLYGDQGDNYSYENGAHAIIPIKWEEASHTLTIGQRIGHYAGMPDEIKFNIVWVSSGHGVSEAVETRPDQAVIYRGEAITVKAE